MWTVLAITLDLYMIALIGLTLLVINAPFGDEDAVVDDHGSPL